MTTKSLALLLLHCLIGLNAWAQTAYNVRLYGLAKEYSDSELRFYTEEDFISRNQRPLASFSPDVEGNFDVKFPLETPRKLIVELGAYNGVLYAEPGRDYQLMFPPRVDKTASEIYNPYFVPQEVFLAVLNQQGNDLNTLIADLEDSIAVRIEPGLLQLKRNVNKRVLELLLEAFDQFTGHIKNPYYLAYKEYRFHELRYIVYERDPEQLLQKYFTGKPLQLAVPTYVNLFEKVAQNALTLKANKTKWSAHPTIEAQKGLAALRDSLQRFDYLHDPLLKDLYIIYGLHNAFHNKNFTKNKVFNLLKVLPQEVDPSLRALALRVFTKLAHLSPGTLAPDIELVDAEGNTVRLSEFSGRFIYLGFGTTYSLPFTKDLALMQKLYEKNIPDLLMITVSMDSDFAKMLALKQSSRLGWPFFHYNFNAQVSEAYRLKVFPTYYLIAPDGTLLMSPAPSLSENFLELFQEIHQKYRKDQLRIKTGVKN